VAGPNFHVNVSADFLHIGVHVHHEWNHDAFSDCPNACGAGDPVNFNTTADFEIVWLFPLPFTGLPLDFRGFTDIVLPKDVDGNGNQTATEVLARPQLNLDIGKLMFAKPRKLDAYFHLELWENKFGNDHANYSSVEGVSPVFGVKYHF
jgi:nucleoside-specific outer membrane channel protein Tsx